MTQDLESLSSPSSIPRLPRLRRWLPFALPVAVLAATFVLFTRMNLHRARTDSDYARDHGQPLPVRVYEVDAAQLNTGVSAECTAKPNPLIQVRGKLGDRPVRKTHTSEGQMIKAGEPLVTLVTDPEQMGFARARDLTDAYKELVRSSGELVDYYQGMRDQGLGLERDLRQARVEVARANVELARAEADLRTAQSGLEYAKVVAPVSGLVLEVAQPGEAALPGAPLATLAVIDPILLECWIPEEKLTRVRTGLELEATFYGKPGDAYRGQVVRIDALQKEEERLVSIQAALANPQGIILPGLHGIAQVRNEQRSLRVPSVSLVNPRDDLAQVFVITPQNEAHLRQIRVGGASGGYTQVLQGLVIGERIVVAGQLGLEQGDVVRVDEVANRVVPR